MLRTSFFIDEGESMDVQYWTLFIPRRIITSHAPVLTYASGVILRVDSGIPENGNASNTKCAPSHPTRRTRRLIHDQPRLLYRVRTTYPNPLGRTTFDEKTPAAACLKCRRWQFVVEVDESVGRDWGHRCSNHASKA